MIPEMSLHNNDKKIVYLIPPACVFSVSLVSRLFNVFGGPERNHKLWEMENDSVSFKMTYKTPKSVQNNV